MYRLMYCVLDLCIATPATKGEGPTIRKIARCSPVAVTARLEELGWC